MSSEQISKLQDRFAKFHKMLVLFLCGYIFTDVVANDRKVWELYPILVILALFTAEYFILNSSKSKPIYLLSQRYLQVLCCIYFLVQSEALHTFGLSLICLSFFTIEYYLTFDFGDSYYRSIFLLTVGIPLEILSVLFYVIHGKLDIRLLMLCFMLAIYMIIVYMLAKTFAKIMLENDERIFAQNRLIDNVNETNEALRINQEKVKKANEQLGVQKIKLEAAYNKINSVNSEMMIQNDIIKSISSSLELGKLMTLITESVLNEIGVDVCSIVLYPEASECNDMGMHLMSESKKRTRFKIRTRLSPSFTEHLSNCIKDHCFEAFLNINSTYVDNRVDEKKYSFLKKGLIGSLIIVPLIKNESIIGCLFVGHPKYEYFEDNIGFFEGIVAQFLVALNNTNLYAKMETMATCDGLTGIYNRRHLTQLFNASMNDSIINKSALSVALFDIDHFKNINDTYGHLFGDVVIQTIASLAARIAEEYEGIVGRYGGEEFVIIFPGLGLRDAYIPVSVLHREVKEMDLIHNGQNVVINVSVGITSYPETCKNPGELLNRADWAMYYSKQNGRDRITIDSDEIRELVMLK